MIQIPVIAIFDVGKTNKKLFLFNKRYEIVFEQAVQLKETIDEDGDVCEDLSLLTEWIKKSIEALFQMPDFKIKAINFSAYGASFVHIMNEGDALLPLYNYLKPYPKDVAQKFYDTYGDIMTFATETASPDAGNLNAGMQLYRLKILQPILFKAIKTSLHLPQYLSFLFTGKMASDMTSIGCHTALWNFEKKDYHSWVYKEQVDTKFAPIRATTDVTEVLYNDKTIMAGIGMHDSSAALIPYLVKFKEPFVLISTGTWCISLCPFNNTPLTSSDLKHHCLAYIGYNGQTVKASRLFAGHWHEQQVQKLAAYFSTSVDHFLQVRYEPSLIEINTAGQQKKEIDLSFTDVDFSSATDYTEAYHLLMQQIVDRQIISTSLIINETGVKNIYVDGGFSSNVIYMNSLAKAFPGLEVSAATISQATALGAALVIHHTWNEQKIPADIIQLKRYNS